MDKVIGLFVDENGSLVNAKHSSHRHDCKAAKCWTAELHFFVNIMLVKLLSRQFNYF